ncbi:MAG: hypothetical protein ACOY46_00195 [Bacillota bacterium]
MSRLSRATAYKAECGSDGQNNDVANGRAKEELGWKTKVTYSESMQRIRDWVNINMK